MHRTHLLNFSESEIEANLYRIFGLHRFLEVLERKCLTLVSPAEWEDPFENFVHRYFEKQFSDSGKVMRWYGGNLLGQCWTFHRETDAMWRIYSPQKNGVKVKVKASGLLDVLWRSNFNTMLSPTCCFLGKVQYKTKKDLTEILSAPDLEEALHRDDTARRRAELLLMKRKEFAHEKEARLIFEFIGGRQLRDGKFYDIPINPNELFEQVILDPRMSAVEFKMYEAGIKALGYVGTIGKSSLYELNF